MENSLEGRIACLEKEMQVIQVKYDNLRETVQEIKKDTESISTINMGINNLGLKLDNMSETIKKQDLNIGENSRKLYNLETASDKNISNIVKKATWVIISSGLAGLVGYFIAFMR